MNRKFAYFILLPTTLFTMGIALPSCPGQEAMQQQVDAANATNTEIKKQVVELDSQVKAMNGELTNAKTLLAQVSETVLQQREVVTGLQTAVQEHSAKLMAVDAKKSPAARPVVRSPAKPTRR